MITERRSGDASILRAMAAGAVRVRFAPLVRLDDGSVDAIAVRLHALASGPERFLAVETLSRQWSRDTAIAVGDRLTSRALKAAGRWRREDDRLWRVAIPACSAELAAPDYAVRLLAAARRAAVRLDRIRVDCPLPWSHLEMRSWRGTMDALRSVGIRFSVRVSASAIAHFDRMHPAPFDEIVLVGGLTKRLTQSVRTTDIGALSDLLLLAEMTGTRICAESVEDSLLVDALRELGFFAAAGPYFGEFESESHLRSTNLESMAERALAAAAPRRLGAPRQTALPA